MFRSSTEFSDFKAAELKDALDVIEKEERSARKGSAGHSHLDEMLMRVPATPLVLWIDKVKRKKKRWGVSHSKRARPPSFASARRVLLTAWNNTTNR